MGFSIYENSEENINYHWILKCSLFFGKTSVENILLLVLSALHNADKYSIKLQNFSCVILEENFDIGEYFTSLSFSQKYGLTVIRKSVGVFSMKLFFEDWVSAKCQKVHGVPNWIPKLG